MATKTKAGGDGLALPPAIDPAIEVGVLADGTIRFWCFASYDGVFRLCIREARGGGKPSYRDSGEWFESGPAAEAEVARRNAKAVRRA